MPKKARSLTVLMPIRDGVVVGDRDDRVDLVELAAEHVQGLLGAGDVRDDEVEGLRASHHARDGVLQRARRVARAL